MRHTNHFRVLLAVCLCIVLTLLVESCGKDSGIQAPEPGTTIGGYDPVFNDDGGFIITYGMLDQRYNKMTFPGTHNSGAFDMIAACDCQDLTIWQQLTAGIRHIEFDVNYFLYICHGACHSIITLEDQLRVIRHYADAHPHQVITVKIGDLSDLEASDSFERINGRLENSGLDQYICNWDPSKGKNNPGRCYIPDPWPTLREMIESGKNVMFLHNREVGEHDIVDEGLARGLAYSDLAVYPYYNAWDLEAMCKVMRLWEPPQVRQKDLPYRLFLAECEPDNGFSAGDRRFASRNNDGRKLYQLAKHAETELLRDTRAVNFIIIDYFASTSAGHLQIDIVDACNRLNYERFGIDWENSEGFWELYPYEFDDSRVERIAQVPSLRDEVEEAISTFNKKFNLDGLEKTGRIVSTSYESGPWDWKRLPEWAVDDDFFTRWCAADNNPNHAWGIDLGEPQAIDEIAIAWEYPHHRPGYRVYASNDDSRFADGISKVELVDDSGWTFVAEGARVPGGERLLWDQKLFQNTGISNWRYIKVKITDTGDDEWPTFYELRLFGPAS